MSAQPVELLFLDIQMPELSGMEFSRILEADTRIIFTTAFEQYALDSYKVNALDYLLKPISYPDFLKAANKALQWYEHMQAPAAEIESIFIKTEYKQVQVELRKILYIEGLKDYVKIFIEDEPHPILSLMSMKSLEEMLPASRFIRVHRSFIVQPEKDQGDRTEPDRVRKRIYPDLRQLQTEACRISGATVTQFQLTMDN